MLNELHKSNLKKLEDDRVKSVKARAAVFCEGYKSAVVIFKNTNDCHVKHLDGVTEIIAHTHMVYLSRLRVFSRHGGDYKHLYLPITVTGFGGWHQQIKVNVFWERK